MRKESLYSRKNTYCHSAETCRHAQEMRVVATAPDFYPDLVALGSVQSLLGLLSHENTDIAVAVVDLLQEMTDADNLSGLATNTFFCGCRANE